MLAIMGAMGNGRHNAIGVVNKLVESPRRILVVLKTVHRMGVKSHRIHNMLCRFSGSQITSCYIYLYFSQRIAKPRTKDSADTGYSMTAARAFTPPLLHVPQSPHHGVCTSPPKSAAASRRHHSLSFLHPCLTFPPLQLISAAEGSAQLDPTSAPTSDQNWNHMTTAQCRVPLTPGPCPPAGWWRPW